RRRARPGGPRAASIHASSGASSSMCGIAGVFFRDREPRASAAPRVARAMAASLAHRGPDSAGFHSDGPLALGMRRLRVIDVEGGDQPIFSEDGRVAVVFNGEIYNYRELREELVRLGHTFRTLSDTETIVHGFEEWGEDVL